MPLSMTSATGVTLLLLAAIFGDVLSQTSGSLRLRNYYSTTSSSGRLEIYYSSYYGWLPFIINGFDMHEADLACKTLGYSFATRYAKVDSLGYYQASTTYSIYNLQCPTSATSFSSCSYSRTSVYSHSGDVGIQCTSTRSSLRLISSSGYTTTQSSGRLQIYINNTWGTVCDDDFGSLEAGIACRQLGFFSYSYYNNAGDLYSYSSYISSPIWLDNLNQCGYYSTDLRDCTNAVGVNNCQHSEDIVLTCSTSFPDNTVAPTVDSNSLRLVSNNYNDYSGGRLEIYYYYYDYGYAWRPFCSTYFNSRDADLACKKLGYLRASSYGRVGSLGYTQGSGLYSIRSDCYSYTSRFDYCSKSATYCSHYNDVALKCVNYVSPTDYYTQSLSSGAVAGLIIGLLTLISCVFTGVTLCVVAIVVYNKKRPSQVRTVNVAQNTPEMNYGMSDVTEQDNTTVSEPAPRYTPSPFTPIVFEQEIYPQNQGDMDNSGVEEEEYRDNNEEDDQPLIIN